MEERLIDAATKGSLDLLKAIMVEDELILDKVVLGFFSRNPLHTAAWYCHTEFVKELLQLNPMLARVLDSTNRTALYLATTRGNVDIVKVLTQEAPEMCLARDRDGRNPVHIAAMNGNVDLLKELVQVNPHAARARLDRDGTILHLCVKLNQFTSLQYLLETIGNEGFVNAKDCEGNTILHLAAVGGQHEILKYLIEKHVIEKEDIDLNAKNAEGQTALDLFVSSTAVGHEESDEMKSIRVGVNAKRRIKTVLDEWISRNRDALMVVISLIATIAFQAGVSPPGGVWQDNSNGHHAGESVMAYHYPDSYKWYLCCNTLGFVASLVTLSLLNFKFSQRNMTYWWVLMAVIMLAITFVMATYTIAVFWVTPKKHRRTLIGIIAPLIVLFTVTVFLLLLRTRFLLAQILQDLFGILSSAIRVPKFEEVKEAEGAEIQRGEVLPSEHSNSDSVTGRQTDV